MTKVVILSGGRGSRLQEHTGEVPKPMLLVGGKPILQHIIDNFVRCGYGEFIIPVGYLSGKVREYFRSNYKFVEEHAEYLFVQKGNVSVTIVETGMDTLTGGRLLRLKDYLTEPFMMTYGDGLCNINPSFVERYGKEMDKNVVTAVHPIPRFGSIVIAPDMQVQAFTEKIINKNEWINGGFMYLHPYVLGYISGDDSNFERDVMPRLVWDNSLFAFQYEGYFRPIDTVNDLKLANDDFKNGVFRW